MGTNAIAVAIDGPAAAGKSTVAKIVANELAYIYIDTGAMYRALTLKVLRKQIPLDEDKAITNLLADTDIQLKQSDSTQHVLMDGEDVTSVIRSEHVTNNVSYVAKHAIVREEMVNRQRELARKRGVVMDGRDIGTHVIPDAEVKIFLKATVEERARRRYEENMQKGFAADLEKLKEEIEQRDRIDSKREVAPLVQANDAIELDTTDLSINDVAAAILEKVNKVLKNRGG
ncbi:(d)CMP kinase [Lentibacillus cibarius]|uniref:Cytidylate kinase n=1 Tax=Lentibacillus cibarius TaxID=2583219 RepID=A0A5S3QPY0_9BACI|nr:(d)CMP kinase [Lentibacillus cibarius]TMN23728.1 (d)CMP kinase [Lentibacillus cibarius]